ncbi:hypothetical protein V8G45_27450 [Klebsiella pneumoniae]|uniref:hypothetical protein n=2 Tax=Klebsiella pneumoniae TaxID=573 RepID=UPI003005D5A6
MKIYGLPQALTGNETVTIQQEQNGQVALCTMPLSQLNTILASTAWANDLPTNPPSAKGVVWNNDGVISIS